MWPLPWVPSISEILRGGRRESRHAGRREWERRRDGTEADQGAVRGWYSIELVHLLLTSPTGVWAILTVPPVFPLIHLPY